MTRSSHRCQTSASEGHSSTGFVTTCLVVARELFWMAQPLTSPTSPPGSMLGPLLFNIIMNSISTLPLSRNSNLIVYANDILLYKPVDSAEDINQLQQDVDLILKWMTSQGLTDNQSKTQLLPLTRSRNALHLDRWSFNRPCSSVKYLGVVISSDLSWSNHISSVCKKARRHLATAVSTTRLKEYVLNCICQPCCPSWTTAVPLISAPTPPLLKTHKNLLAESQRTNGRSIMSPSCLT